MNDRYDHGSIGPDHQLPSPGHTAQGKGSRRPLILFLIGFAILFAIVVLAGLIPRLIRDHEIKQRAEKEKNAKPVVEVQRVQQGGDEAGLVEPGTTIPLEQAYVYARANGYLKTRLVDIGDRVHEGQLLATLDVPEMEDDLARTAAAVEAAFTATVFVPSVMRS